MARWLGAPIAVLMLLVGVAARSEPRTGAKAYHVGGDVVAPVVLLKPELKIPEGATPGIVVLEAVINTKGRVENVRVLRSTSKGSARAAVKVVRQWRYRPATLHGKPIPVYLTVVVHLCA
jgi:TonB family protein